MGKLDIVEVTQADYNNVLTYIGLEKYPANSLITCKGFGGAFLDNNGSVTSLPDPLVDYLVSHNSPNVRDNGSCSAPMQVNPLGLDARQFSYKELLKLREEGLI